ncbi:MAG: RNA pseudouridine synthase [Treponema sp.]|jgi:23S rRNA pseudouridine955/2504/2580 synthase|nr:RNA pseudouridine synthase [Treponema sp.]
MKNIEILYEDNSIIVINKPAGLAVQGGEGVKSSLDKILAEIRNPAPLLTHRLDKDTSGIILAAKTRNDAARFSRFLGGGSKIKSGNVIKNYTAVCANLPEQNEGIISIDLEVHGKIKKTETRYTVKKSGKIELPEIESSKLKESIDFSVLEIELGTGRMHQIRRHLSMIGNPILGDDKYGNFKLNKRLQKAIGLKRLLLHASRLVIKEYNLDIQVPPPWALLDNPSLHYPLFCPQ